MYRSAKLQKSFKLPFAAWMIAWTSSWAHSANCTGSSSTGQGSCPRDVWTSSAQMRINLREEEFVSASIVEQFELTVGWEKALSIGVSAEFEVTRKWMIFKSIHCLLLFSVNRYTRKQRQQLVLFNPSAMSIFDYWLWRKIIERLVQYYLFSFVGRKSLESNWCFCCSRSLTLTMPFFFTHSCWQDQRWTQWQIASRKTQQLLGIIIIIITTGKIKAQYAQQETGTNRMSIRVKDVYLRFRSKKNQTSRFFPSNKKHWCSVCCLKTIFMLNLVIVISDTCTHREREKRRRRRQI